MTFASPFAVIPFTNATLTKIEGGGTSEDYGTAAGSDTTRWSGSQGVWVGEELRRDITGLELNEVARTHMKVGQGLGAQRGDSVTYTQNAQPHTREVDDIKEFDLVGITHLYFVDE